MGIKLMVSLLCMAITLLIRMIKQGIVYYLSAIIVVKYVSTYAQSIHHQLRISPLAAVVCIQKCILLLMTS
jgi:hypothetical protein